MMKHTLVSWWLVVALLCWIPNDGQAQQDQLRRPKVLTRRANTQNRRLFFWDDWFGNNEEGEDSGGTIWDTVNDFWDGLFDGDSNSTSNEGGSIGDWWNSFFDGGSEEGGNTTDDNPFSNLLDDLDNLTDAVFSPITEAVDAAEDSETPLTTFLQELLDQPSSQEPVRDYIKEAFNRTDTPVLDFLAGLFDTNTSTTTETVDDFVRDLIDGNTNPLQGLVNNIAGEAIFEEKDCSVVNANAPPCAYNWAGDEGVWVCRTLYNGFSGDAMPSETLCVPPQFILQNNDECGACNGGPYPEPCKCSCDLDGQPGAGSYVALEGSDLKQCVDSKWAIGNLGQLPFECQEACE